MSPSGLHYFPVTLPFLLLVALFGLVVGMAALRLLRYASISMGISLPGLATILALSLLGSYVNIPIAYLPEKETTTLAQINFFGVTYAIPVVREWAATVLAVNVGGAVIPIIVSIHLIAKHELWSLSTVGVAIVAVICHLVARPVPASESPSRYWSRQRQLPSWRCCSRGGRPGRSPTSVAASAP